MLTHALLTRTLLLSACLLAAPAARLAAQATGAPGASVTPGAAAAPGGWIAQDEVVYQIFVRSFRDSNGDRIGDLKGIQQSLGYLHDLGVTSLLLTPVNPSPTYHNYFASRFDGVDSAYGTAKDLRDLIEAVHARGMKIYLDEEDQYAAQGNPWLDSALGNPRSPYANYILYDDSSHTRPSPIIYGLTALPTWTGARVPVATVNLRDTAVVAYVRDLFASLVDPDRDGRFDDGVDGFRLDHMMDDLDGNPRLMHLFADFWAPVFARSRAVNPGVKFIAEQADWGYGVDWLTRGGADLVFGFPLRSAIVSLNCDSIAAAITATRHQVPAGKGVLVFIENHDVNRFASAVGGDPRKERVGAALDVLLKGTPLIYYGQEIGMKGMQSHAWNSDANDIPDREAFRWTRRLEDPGTATWYKDTGPWWTDRFGRDDDGISVAEETHDPKSLLSYYRRLLAVRRSRPELRMGDEQVVTTDRPAVLAVLRSTAEAASLVIVNLSDSAATAVVPVDSVPAPLATRPLRELLSGRGERRSAGALRVELAPWEVKVIGSIQKGGAR